MLDKLFVSLRDSKNSYLNAREGSEFEDRIIECLKNKLGLNRIYKDLISPEDWKAVDHHMRNRLGTEFMDLPNPALKKSFLYQPYGSQKFPDFIVFTDNKVVPIEIKFSTKDQSKPVWNGHVPRANAFYVFGSYGKKDITFFCGDDVIRPEHRQALFDFFTEIRSMEDKIRENVPGLDTTNRGFTPYVRAAFGQKRHHSDVHMSFFSHPERKQVEDLAVEKSENL